MLNVFFLFWRNAASSILAPETSGICSAVASDPGMNVACDCSGDSARVFQGSARQYALTCRTIGRSGKT